jgi:hypothetical protein
MNLDYSLLELIFKLISYTILFFGILAVIEQFTSGRLISKLEIRLHYFTNRDGERVLHTPPLGEPKVWEVFDVITAMWVMYRARAWAKRSEGGRMLYIPEAPVAQLKVLFPSRAQMFQRLRIYLQAKVQQPGTWIRRASESVSQPDTVGDETEYQFFLSIEHGNPEAKAIYVHVLAVDTINEIVESKGAFAKTIHPHWPFSEERIQILDEGCRYLQKIRDKPEDENNLLFWL